MLKIKFLKRSHRLIGSHHYEAGIQGKHQSDPSPLLWLHDHSQPDSIPTQAAQSRIDSDARGPDETCHSQNAAKGNHRNSNLAIDFACLGSYHRCPARCSS